jgi:hypothetical protein
MYIYQLDLPYRSPQSCAICYEGPFDTITSQFLYSLLCTYHIIDRSAGRASNAIGKDNTRSPIFVKPNFTALERNKGTWHRYNHFVSVVVAISQGPKQLIIHFDWWIFFWFPHGHVQNPISSHSTTCWFYFPCISEMWVMTLYFRHVHRSLAETRFMYIFVKINKRNSITIYNALYWQRI